jgi:ferredoxin--NADP+ reductase
MSEQLRVAVVGTGPSACYAIAELLARRPDVAVTVVDRALTPYGLVRAGVAPDHQEKKQVISRFEGLLAHSAVTLRLGVEIGRDLSHDEMLRHHHAVLYAVGTPHGLIPDVPGAALAGSHPASGFAAWYNADPEHAEDVYDLSGERVAVVGNGNVALDVARIVLTPPESLDRTDIADHALAALRRSTVREVVILGRRGPAQAAFSGAELIELLGLPGVDVGVQTAPAGTDDESSRLAVLAGSAEARSRLRLLEGLPPEPTWTTDRRRVLFRHLVSPFELWDDGAGRVSAIRLAHTTLVPGPGGRPVAQPSGRTEEIPVSLVLWAIGHRGRPLDGLPHDPRSGTIPNFRGRVLAATANRPSGAYVAGWVKRGPSGVIGSNRACAVESVTALLEDADAGRLPAPPAGPAEFAALLAQRRPEALDHASWTRIDRTERSAGREAGRPRVKLTTRAALLAAAAPTTR